MTDPTPSLPRIPRMCAATGCTRPSNGSRGGRCNTHEPARKARQDAIDARHNADTSYYGTAEWKRLRDLRKAMDYGMCVVCSRAERLVAHHIKARRDGGADSIHNLTTLCSGKGGCHNKVESGDRQATELLEEHLRYRTG